MPSNPVSDLKKQFAESPPPAPEELRGYYAVRLLTGFLPPLRFFGHRKFFPADAVNPESGSGGFNEFLGKIRIGSFMIEPAESILGDGQGVLLINYNRPGNPFWLRILNDELKKTGDGRYLGRGVLRLFGVTFNSFYFSVEREDRARRESGPGGTCRSRRQPRPVIEGRDQAVFNRLADTIIPQGGVFGPGAADFELVPRVNEYLVSLPAALRRLTPLMLRYVEWASLIWNGRRFSRLSPPRAGRFLERMERGRLLYHRHIVLFLKLLVMTAFYEREKPAAAIGYIHGCHLQDRKEEAL